MTLEDGTYKLSKNVDKELPVPLCVITQNSAVLSYFAAEA
jgi:hypothetical protein